jgi:ABC-type nitrate/sulfonate/bicarbonate transport system permease component
VTQRPAKANPVFLIALTLGFFALWEIMTRLLGLPAYLIPAPSAVFATAWADAEVIFSQSLVTVFQWVVGLVFSIGIGFGLAVACFRWRRVRAVLSPVLMISQTIPYLAFAPLLLIWLGLGMAPKIVLVVLSCAFPIAVALQDGFDRSLKEFHVVVAMIKLRWREAFRHVYLPAALPDFFTGLRMTAAYAFVSTVMAELIGSERGLGIYLTRAQASYRTDRVVAAVGIIVVVSLLTTWAVDRIRTRVVFWQAARK